MSIDKVRSRGWCFTLNNWTHEEFETIKQLKCNYLIVGRETAPTTGTPHLQGFIYFKNSVTGLRMRKHIPRAFFVEQRGTHEQASDYCMKEDEDYFEKGELPEQGARNDLKEVKQIIADGGNMRKAVMEATSYQSVRMAEIILKYHEKTRDWKPEVKWFYGPTGTGKTRQAFEELPDAYVTMEHGKWWEGYDGHENVIIDDMRQTFMSYASFLRLIDRYAFRVECKGGSRQFLAKKIIITSPFHPNDIYDIGEDKQQLLRRIDDIVKFE